MQIIVDIVLDHTKAYKNNHFVMRIIVNIVLDHTQADKNVMQVIVNNVLDHIQAVKNNHFVMRVIVDGVLDVNAAQVSLNASVIILQRDPSTDVLQTEYNERSGPKVFNNPLVTWRKI